MVVDHLRSCYRTTMNFYRDGFNAVPIRWFFAAPGAMTFPGVNLFVSNNWWKNRGQIWPHVGEVEGAARTYDKGSNGNQKMGVKFCGELEWYQYGISVHDGIIPDPNCCPDAPLVADISVVTQAAGGVAAQLRG